MISMPVPFKTVDPHEYENWGEISKREYPKAMRPQIVVNRFGGWMRWDAWLKHPTALDCVGMIFEDGSAVGNISTDQKRKWFAEAFSADPVA